MGQQGLLPRHADPKLWVMETRGGEEREAAVKLMQKAVTMAAAGTPLAITSAFAQDHLRVRMACSLIKQAVPSDYAVCCLHKTSEVLHAVPADSACVLCCGAPLF